MTSDVNAAALSEMMKRFFQELRRLSMEVRTNNKLETKKFTDDEAVDITNFFFTEMMGPRCLGRISSLIRHYNKHGEYGIDKGAAARAEALAQDPDTPASIRRFFGAFSKVERAKMGASSVFGQLQHAELNLDLLHQFNALKTMVQDSNKQLMDFLKKNGYSTAKGVSWQSLIITYLADALQIDNIALRNNTQSAQGIAALVDQFGFGILTVLPPGANNK